VLAWTAAPDEDEPAHGYLEPRARAIVREYVAGLREPLRAVHHAIYVDRAFQVDAAKRLGAVAAQGAEAHRTHAP
jgi:hypothetical protein